MFRQLIAAAFGTVPVLLALTAQPAPAQDTLRFADLGTCPTASGDPVQTCRVGYRTFGRLNQRRDNAVLVPTWHGGSSAGMRFLLGHDAWIDTTRFYAILVDGLGFGVGTSPSNSRIQPGRRFPRLTFADNVAAQRRLVIEHLRIPRLHAVIGWSMGGMQAIEWALSYPADVGRVVSVAGAPRMDVYEGYFARMLLGTLDLAERAGLPRDSLALRMAELWHMVATTPVHENALPRDSVDAMLEREAEGDWLAFHPEDNRVQIESWMAFDGLARARAAAGGRRRVGPPTLLVYFPGDHVTTAESFRAYARATGATAIEFDSACGHMAPVCDTAAIGAQVRPFLVEGPEVR